MEFIKTKALIINVLLINLFTILFFISGCEKDEESSVIDISANWNVDIFNEHLYKEESFVVKITQEKNIFSLLILNSGETGEGEISGNDIVFTIQNDSIGEINYIGTIIDKEIMTGIRSEENSSVSITWEAKKL